MYETIYLVDDFEMVNTLHSILLKNIGITDSVKTFTNPELALEDLSSSNRDLQSALILLDINMPEMSGFEFLEILKERSLPFKIDVVVVTSSISDMDRAKANKFPMLVKDYVIKPLQKDKLKTLATNAA